MRTKLEIMVDYLAGREGQEATQLRAELDDPSSEASRFLEATRSRSIALLGGPGPAGAGPPPRRSIVRRSALVAAAVGAILAVSAASLRLGEARLRRLEAALARGEARSREVALRLEAALARASEPPRGAPAHSPAHSPAPALPPPGPRNGEIETALVRVEAGLGNLERRVEGLGRSGPRPAMAGPDPAVAEIRRELEILRRERAASDQATGRQIQDLRASIQEVGQLLRMALNRPQGTLPGPIPGFEDPQPPGMPPQVVALVGGLANGHPQVRIDAADQLARMGPAARGAVPALQQLLAREGDVRVRAAAQSALAVLRQE